MPVDQMHNPPEERQVDMAFLALAIQRVEAGRPGPLRDRILSLFTELAEWVRRGHDLNDLESLYPLLSLDSQQTLDAAFGSIFTQPNAFVDTLDTTDRLLDQAQQHVAWKIHRNGPA